jgi:hypothetical protein
VDLKANFILDIAFSNASPAKGKIVRKFLIEVHEHILNEVVPKFENLKL